MSVSKPNRITSEARAIAVLVAVVNLTGGPRLRRFHERSGYRWFVPFGVVATVGIFLPAFADGAGAVPARRASEIT